MKIAYLARADLNKGSGVIKKITRQLLAWQKAGHEVRLFALTKKTQRLWEGLQGFPLEFFEFNNYFDLLLQSIKTQAAILNWSPDLIYWRYSSYYPGLTKLIKTIPTVTEINSNYDIEYRKINRLGYILHKLTKEFAFKNSTAFVVLTQELGEWVSIYHKPVLILGDSIDLNAIPQFRSSHNDQPHLVCVATRPFPWIALDKIILLAEKFPNWQINLVGIGPDSIRVRNFPKNVKLHGFLDKNQYQIVMQQSDIAIGTLGLHRIGLSQMAPLKLREYLAYGLPSIIAYKDTDFPEKVPFLLQIPNTENNIVENFHQIEDFVYKWKGKRVDRAQIKHLDSQQKEQIRLSFFKTIIHSNY